MELEKLAGPGYTGLLLSLGSADFITWAVEATEGFYKASGVGRLSPWITYSSSHRIRM